MMINKKLDIIEEQLKTIKVIIDSDEYFKSLEKSIEYVNKQNTKYKNERDKYKEVLNKIKVYINTTTYKEVFKEDEKSIKEFWFIKDILELLEEIE